MMADAKVMIVGGGGGGGEEVGGTTVLKLYRKVKYSPLFVWLIRMNPLKGCLLRSERGFLPLTNWSTGLKCDLDIIF